MPIALLNPCDGTTDETTVSPQRTVDRTIPYRMRCTAAVRHALGEEAGIRATSSVVVIVSPDRVDGSMREGEHELPDLAS
jgi:hypothetical protein